VPGRAAARGRERRELGALDVEGEPGVDGVEAGGEPAEVFAQARHGPPPAERVQVAFGAVDEHGAQGGRAGGVEAGGPGVDGVDEVEAQGAVAAAVPFLADLVEAVVPVDFGAFGFE
ncbi:hypothetical protein ADL26_17875, partial [Thermoactinomyces vulgaris]